MKAIGTIHPEPKGAQQLSAANLNKSYAAGNHWLQSDFDRTYFKVKNLAGKRLISFGKFIPDNIPISWKFRVYQGDSMNVDDAHYTRNGNRETWDSGEAGDVGSFTDGTNYIYAELTTDDGTDPRLTPNGLTVGTTTTWPPAETDWSYKRLIGELEYDAANSIVESYKQKLYDDPQDQVVIPDANSQYATVWYSIEHSPRTGRHLKTLQLYGIDDATLVNGNAWTSGKGIPFFNKSGANGVLQWTGYDSDFHATQKSIERSPGAGDANLTDLIQINGMDDDPALLANPVGIEFCRRSAVRGVVSFATMNWVDISGAIDHDNTGGAGDSSTHDDHNDGLYWGQGSAWDSANKPCYGLSIGRTVGEDVRTQAINLVTSELIAVDTTQRLNWDTNPYFNLGTNTYFRYNAGTPLFSLNATNYWTTASLRANTSQSIILTSVSSVALQATNGSAILSAVGDEATVSSDNSTNITGASVFITSTTDDIHFAPSGQIFYSGQAGRSSTRLLRLPAADGGILEGYMTCGGFTATTP